MAILALVLLPLGWACVLYVRRGTWRLTVAAPEAMLDFSIRRCRVSITLALMNQYAVLIGVIAGLASRFYHGQGLDLGLEPDSKFWLRVGAVALFSVWLFGAEWYKRRKRAELERLETLRTEFNQ